MVSAASSDGDRHATSTTEIREPVVSSSNTENASPSKVGSVCFQGLREELVSKGISKDAASIILSSWTPSTQKQYGAYVSKWLLFCSERQFPTFQPAVMDLIEFLTLLHTSGIGYSAINTAKSAVSSFVYLLSNVQLGQHILVHQFMKGIVNIKPVLPKTHCTWNVDLVLAYLRSL